MISRFNFYDVYCYLIPGASLQVLLWLPFGLAGEQFLSTIPHTFASTVFAIILAYVFGLVLDNFADKTFISDIPTTVGKGKGTEVVNRKRSSYILDDLSDDYPLSVRPLATKVKEIVHREIVESMGLDIGLGANVESPDKTTLKSLEGRRGAAFIRCRNTLVHNDRASLCQRMHGMYAMWRGLSVAFLLAGFFYLGIALRQTGQTSIPLFALQAVFAGHIGGLLLWACMQTPRCDINTANRWKPIRPWKWWRLSIWATIAIYFGLYFSSVIPIQKVLGVVPLTGMSAAALILFYRGGRAYLHFADLWVQCVYYDYAEFVSQRASGNKK